MKISKRLIFLLFLIYFSWTLSCAQTKNDRFNELIKTVEIDFKVPENLIEKSHRKSYKKWHQSFANRYNTFEIRYFINPIKKESIDFYNQNREKSSNSVMDPNTAYLPLFEYLVYEISGQMPNWIIVDSTNVIEEFNCDWGASTTIVPNDEFGKGYYICSVVGLHKQNKADVLIYFLAKNKEVLSENLLKYLHTMTFK